MVVLGVSPRPTCLLSLSSTMNIYIFSQAQASSLLGGDEQAPKKVNVEEFLKIELDV